MCASLAGKTLRSLATREHASLPVTYVGGAHMNLEPAGVSCEIRAMAAKSDSRVPVEVSANIFRARNSPPQIRVSLVAGYIAVQIWKDTLHVSFILGKTSLAILAV